MARQRDTSAPNVWPALVDVVIAIIMILLLFMIIQYISFFLSDELARMKIRENQARVELMIKGKEAKGDIAKGSIVSIIKGERQRLRFSSEVLFDTGQAEFDLDDYKRRRFLTALGDLLKQAHKENLFHQIYIEGHTDNNPMNNRKFESNWELSVARAVFLTDYLITSGALDPKEREEKFLGATGYGEFNYIVKNTTDANRAKNRRIEILLVSTPEKVKIADSRKGD